ncbi:MAG: adenylyltransferase/cytidyltransferase family protein [Selenomonadaceae bacterium]|nr:adenylyltransferase/cytidyltransferase family protein [Selenomonadaceae bacterium]
MYARQTYADLLSLEVFNYLTNHGVNLFYINNLGKIDNIQERKSTLKNIDEGSASIFSKYEDYLIFKDIRRENIFNIIGGQRVTIDVPEYYENSIYCYGPCTALGAFSTDDKTIESYLQNILNETGYKYRVVNCGGVGSGEILNNDLNSLYLIMDTEFKSGDIVIHFGGTMWNYLIHLPKDRRIDFEDIFNNPPFDKLHCFKDISAGHIDESGNEAVAKVIFDRIKPLLIRKESVTPFFDRLERHSKIDSELEKYLKELSKERVEFENIGAIVMNCNPFTKGHMYLIEQALKKVDFLYIFVVEEDLSEFSFKDRFAIVQENCKKFNNVKVIPSGKYMISSFTFAEYFKKEKLQDKNILPAKDVKLFGSFIAPCLNIKMRFVGEEPLDKVTRQYNEAMKKFLGDYGVILVEIPRLKLSNGEIINATKVRKLINEGNFEECKTYLTEETYNYISHIFN